MSEVFEGSNAADGHFFDDIDIFNTTWDNSIHKATEVLKGLKDKGFAILTASKPNYIKLRHF